MKHAYHTSVAACNCPFENGDEGDKVAESLHCVSDLFLGFGRGAVGGCLCKYAYITVKALKVDLWSVEFPFIYKPILYIKLIIRNSLFINFRAC